MTINNNSGAFLVDTVVDAWCAHGAPASVVCFVCVYCVIERGEFVDFGLLFISCGESIVHCRIDRCPFWQNGFICRN